MVHHPRSEPVLYSTMSNIGDLDLGKLTKAKREECSAIRTVRDLFAFQFKV